MLPSSLAESSAALLGFGAVEWAGGLSGEGAAQVTRSPGLQVSQTTAHIPALPGGRPPPALCSLARSPPLAAPTLQRCVAVASLIAKGQEAEGAEPPTSQNHLSSVESREPPELGTG